MVWLLLAAAALPLAGAEWRHYAGDSGSSRHSPIKEINKSNVARLKVAWTYRSGDKGDRGRTAIETTPIVVDGVLYGISPMLKIFALDAATGREIWRFDPYEGSELQARGVSRGVTYWQSGDDKRILFVSDTRLMSLNARTGKLITDFGEAGAVNLRKDLDRDPPGAFSGVTTPGVIYKDLIILGSAVGEGPRPSAPGHIRAYDVRTGKRAWIFHTIPHPGEFGNDTWEGDSWKTAGGANDWGGLSLDEKRGLVFVALGSPAFDFYGGQRLGQNLFGNSVVALEAATGKRVWHFQIVHHDVWDYDLPCAPMLVRAKGRDAVAQVTKHGLLFVFDRETGKPVFPIEERPVPPSDIPGEKVSPTQPFPVKPPPFAPQKFEPTDISPEARAHVMKQMADLRTGGMFMPPSKQGTVIVPGTLGGALWGGASFDPQRRLLFVNSNGWANMIRLVDSKPGSPYPYDNFGYIRIRDGEGYPGTKPPWGVLTAIDLDKGEFAWQIPIGEHKELTARGVPKTGTMMLGGSMSTAGGLVFIGATKDEMFRAIDSDTGKVLWETKLEAGGYATPASYEVKGKQYVVIAAGGGTRQETPSNDAYVAFALP